MIETRSPRPGLARTATLAALFAATVGTLLFVVWDYAANGGFFESAAVLALGLLMGATMTLVLWSQRTEERRVAPPPPTGSLGLMGAAPIELPLPRVVPTLFYERGIADVPVDVPSATTPLALTIQETTGVLCESCGDYFEIDLNPARPARLDCPACNTHLALLGPRHTGDAAEVRCSYCRAPTVVPEATVLAGFHCLTCGRQNRLRAARPSAADSLGGRVAGRIPSLRQRMKQA